MYDSMRDELLKLAEISDAEALRALERLQTLNEQRTTPAEVARGAMAGTIAGTGAALAKGLVHGNVQSGIKDIMGAPTIGGKLLGLGKSVAKNVAGTAAGTAAIGAILPATRRHLDRNAEEAKLQRYLGATQVGPTRQKIRETLGVG